jgi:hypothetical protein
MSYSVSPGSKKPVRTSNNGAISQGYNKINNTDDEESNSGNDLEAIKRQIEGNLSAIQLSIRKLEKLNTSISTESDSR